MSVAYISPKELEQAIENKESIRIVDVRGEDEWKRVGHIPTAELIPFSLLAMLFEERFLDLDEKIVVYCASCGRSVVAAEELLQLGCTNVSVLEGGYAAWDYQINKKDQIADGGGACSIFSSSCRI